ncbi:recombination and DNA strand exchange inhibitor protein [Helicobacter aurati]|uniref:Recombination and DNA strand exchange inhibitor protein n=1 Tax=Helicobacter aurati TaxID=137778 RepID=A0A3D8J6G6_9HELI|nr:Smr/MutS family protein [Helicobacter aurati]RDU72870.1 recombination and DNA strand exchange inhibitor protein [Helicobacter aurati]
MDSNAKFMKKIQQISSLVSKLNLDDFLVRYSEYFSRAFNAPSYDNAHRDLLHTKVLNHILEILDSEKLQALIAHFDDKVYCVSLPTLPKVRELDQQLLWLSKGANLTIEEVIACAQIVKVFYDLQQEDSLQGKQDFFSKYLQSFQFPSDILVLLTYFVFEKNTQENFYCIKRGVDKELDSLRDALESKMQEKERKLNNAIHTPHLEEFLVDTQLHFIQDTLTLLLRAGFANILPAKVIARSNRGFFYVVPMYLESLQQEIIVLQDKIRQRIAFLAAEYSKIYARHLPFLRYVNKEFDCLDRVLARVRFARDSNLEFVFPCNADTDSIVLHEYAHPSLKNPKPITLRFSKNLLLITGVNAGGKTMLLKSVLSALFCVKYFLPFKIHPHKSHIPLVQNIVIISQDPQNSKQDISTFSGRIKEFSKILHQRNLIVGIDEIELGTDSSEAASLYKILLDYLLDNGVKAIVTTHHKFLASLMADNPHTQLLAALYNIKEAKPQYEFIEGIGKSYAMECAALYGIPMNLIMRAKQLHGSQANSLEKLIEKSNEQITQNKQRETKLESLIAQKQAELRELEQMKAMLKKQFETQSLNLKRHYNEAIKEVKMLARQTSLQTESHTQKQDMLKNIHKLLNKASKQKQQEPRIVLQSDKRYEINEWVKYHSNVARIIAKENTHSSQSHKGEMHFYTIELRNGVRLKGIPSIELESTKNTIAPQSSYTLQADIQARTRLDLHGCTREEALVSLEEFLNQALMARFGEVLIVHGRGSGMLRSIVIHYLENADFVRGFVDAPASMGGSGAKIVYLC